MSATTTEAIERAIIRKLCERMLLAGHRIAAVWDGEEYTLAGSLAAGTETYEAGNAPDRISAPLTLAQALDAIYAVDSICTLHFTRRDSDTWGNRGVMLVTGNGTDVISDHHDYPDIGAVIDKIYEELDSPQFVDRLRIEEACS